MRAFIAIVFGCLLASTARAEATFVQTPYAPPKVVFDFYLDDPAKMGPPCTGSAPWPSPFPSRPTSSTRKPSRW